MPPHRALGIGLLHLTNTITVELARTIRVVLAAKFLKKLILHTFSLLNSPSIIVKLLSVPVPAGRLALARLRVPDLQSVVSAAAGKHASIWVPCHRHDPVFAMR